MRFQFQPPVFSEAAIALRRDTRAFLDAERAAGAFTPRVNSWVHYDEAFTRRCGERGLIGIMFPPQYGGRSGSPLERYVVHEEMLAAGAPTGMQWFADRQSGPLILHHGTETVRARILPQIAAGRCCIGVGLSEAGAGSDLAAVKTRAEKAPGGWHLHGSKLWTSHAHRAHFVIVLARTSPATKEDRHFGLSHFIVDMTTPGVKPTPIVDLTGGRDFNEVEFDGTFVPDEYVVGQPGEGWKLVMSELAFERSGPDRVLSTYVLLAALVDRLAASGADPVGIGRLVAHLATLRRMSSAVAGMLAGGLMPNVEAALVKDLGTAFEREIPEVARLLVEDPPRKGSGDPYVTALTEAILAAPSFTLRGGTREILRGIVARQLGLR